MVSDNHVWLLLMLFSQQPYLSFRQNSFCSAIDYRRNSSHREKNQFFNKTFSRLYKKHTDLCAMVLNGAVLVVYLWTKPHTFLYISSSLSTDQILVIFNLRLGFRFFQDPLESKFKIQKEAMSFMKVGRSMFKCKDTYNGLN